MQRLARSAHLGELLQGLRQRVHIDARGRGQQMGAHIGAADGKLRRPRVVRTGQPQKAAGRLKRHPALHHALERLAAPRRHLHRIKKPERVQRPQHRAVQADAVWVRGNRTGPDAHHTSRFEPGARRGGLDLVGLARDAANRVHGCCAAHQATAQTEAAGRLGPVAHQRLRQRAIIGVGAFACVPTHDLSEQGIGRRTARLAQHQGGHAAVFGQRLVSGRAIGKEIDLDRHAALRGRYYGQLDKGAAADQNLAPKGVGLGQQALAVADQVDAPAFAQVGDPGLEVVRIGGQQRVGEHEAPRVRLTLGAAPGLHGRLGQIAAAARKRDASGQDGAPACQANEGSAA